MLTRTQERKREIKRAVRQFLPNVTSQNLAQVRWHLWSEDCEERDLKPLSDLMTGRFAKLIPGPDDAVHLHPPKQFNGQRERSNLRSSQDLGGSAENDGHENGDHENDDGQDDDGEDDDGEDDDGENDNGENDNGVDENGDQDNLPQPSIESTFTDPQTNVMDKHLAGDQLYIKIVYDLRGVPKISDKWLDVDNFPTEVLHFSRQRSLPDIFTRLAEIVSHRLEAQEKESYDNLNQKKMERFLLLRPMLIHECPMKQRAFEFDDSGISRIAVVNDLLSATVDTEAVRRGEFDALDEQTRQPQLTIKLRLIDAVDRVVVTDPLVVIRSGAKEKKSGGGARFYRIGSQANPNAVKDQLVSVSNTLFWRCKFGDDLTGLTIFTASMWSLRGLDICNPDEGQALVNKTPHLEKGTDEAPMDTHDFKRAFQNGTLHSYTDGRLLYDFKSWTNPDIIPGRSRNACSEFLIAASTRRSGGGKSVNHTSLTTWHPALTANDHMQVNQSKHRRARPQHCLFRS